MSRAEAKAFFDAYADCFSRGDVAGIMARWSLPAFISGPRSGAFTDAENFCANTEALCDFYAAQGAVRAHKSILDVQTPYDGVAMVRTGDRLTAADGKLVADWEHTYLLRRGDKGWKVFLAIADGEMAAWNARGTPLGGKRTVQ